MKITIEIDVEPHLSAAEIEDYRRLCEEAEILPEVAIARAIRAEVRKARGSMKSAARRIQEKPTGVTGGDES